MTIFLLVTIYQVVIRCGKVFWVNRSTFSCLCKYVCAQKEEPFRQHQRGGDRQEFGQTVLDFDGVGKASAQVDEMLDNIESAMINGTQLILNKVYDAVGFDAISDDVLRNLVIARICQPGSKMATSAYLKAYFKEDLNHWRIYRYMDKLYNTQQDTAEARRIPGPGPGVSILSPIPSSYREKKKENDSKNRSLPHLGCDVGLEPTTPRTTIWCSTN